MNFTPSKLDFLSECQSFIIIHAYFSLGQLSYRPGYVRVNV